MIDRQWYKVRFFREEVIEVVASCPEEAQYLAAAAAVDTPPTEVEVTRTDSEEATAQIDDLAGRSCAGWELMGEYEGSDEKRLEPHPRQVYAIYSRASRVYAFLARDAPPSVRLAQGVEGDKEPELWALYLKPGTSRAEALEAARRSARKHLQARLENLLSSVRELGDLECKEVEDVDEG